MFDMVANPEGAFLLGVSIGTILGIFISIALDTME